MVISHCLYIQSIMTSRAWLIRRTGSLLHFTFHVSRLRLFLNTPLSFSFYAIASHSKSAQSCDITTGIALDTAKNLLQAGKDRLRIFYILVMAILSASQAGWRTLSLLLQVQSSLFLPSTNFKSFPLI